MIKNEDRMQSHTMELPRLIEIGEKNIGDFGKFLNSLNKPKKVSLICGTNVQKVIKIKVEKSLKIKKIQFIWHTSIDNQIKSINKIEKNVKKDNSNLIVGIGGGRSVDTAKLISYNLSIPFVSIPTPALINPSTITRSSSPFFANSEEFSITILALIIAKSAAYLP